MRKAAVWGSTWGALQAPHMLVDPSSSQEASVAGRWVSCGQVSHTGVSSPQGHITLGGRLQLRERSVPLNTQVLTEDQGNVRTARCSAEGAHALGPLGQSLKQ